MPTCKGCGRLIVWIKTRDGKLMPCDPKRVFARPAFPGMERGTTVVTKSGEILRGQILELPEEGVMLGYIPHWGTCPKADKFRNQRKAGG